MSEEKAEKKGATITLKLTLPTVGDVKEALTRLFPGLKVEVEEKEKGEKQE